MCSLLHTLLPIDENRQDFEWRVQLEHVGTSPPLEPGDADARL